MTLTTAHFEGFRGELIHTHQTVVFARYGGRGPAILLLHGFPETHLMWRDVVPLLARDFTVVVADLPGYGQSGCPSDAEDHASMSKRSMGAELVDVMQRLGYGRFAVAGHDRGGRVAYSMALDRPETVSHLGVLDVIPTSEVWDRADDHLALSFWPFSLLAQPSPLPERLITSAPDAVVDNALGCWGSPPDAFPADVRLAYIDALRDPQHVHAICEEYRAAASIDRLHDRADQAAGRRVTCPVLAVWSDTCGLATWYQDRGGPLGIWRDWADDVRGQAMAGGHFFPEEAPVSTATHTALCAGSARKARGHGSSPVNGVMWSSARISALLFGVSEEAHSALHSSTQPRTRLRAHADAVLSRWQLQKTAPETRSALPSHRPTECNCPPSSEFDAIAPMLFGNYPVWEFWGVVWDLQLSLRE